MKFTINTVLLIPRPGPSASQAPSPSDIPDGMDPNSVAEIVKAISLLQVVMKEPWAQKLLQQNLSIPPVDTSDGELKDARDGKPSSSVPQRVAPTTPLPPAPEVPVAKPVAPVEPVIPSAPAVAPTTAVAPAAEAAVVNSSTHRAAHARLVRKMQSLGETEAPNMTRLFNGTRKDGCLTQKKK